MNEQHLRKNFAAKLSYYRKSAGLTQFELAEKLNYSDKSISKWERAEGLPDLVVLVRIAELFSVTVNDLISDSAPLKPAECNHNRRLITIISIGVVWLLAATGFAVLTFLDVTAFKPWLCFIYAIPASAIVSMVFTSVWLSKWRLATSISILMWSLVLSFVFTFNIVKITVFFIVAAVLQVLVILVFMLKFKKDKI